MPNPTVTLEGEFSAGVWTDVTSDVLSRGRIVVDRGISGDGPKDLVARQGSMRFVMNNAQTNLAGALGNYSPGHSSARSGFDIGTFFRLKLSDGTNTQYKFYGKVTSIEPTAGRHRSRDVEVECRDYIGELNEQKISLLGVQLNKRNDQIVTTLVAEAAIAPKNTSYSTGPDTFAYALHTDKDEGTTIINAIQKAMQSGLDYFYVKGNATDGETLVYESRHDRIKNTTVDATFNDDMRDLTVMREIKRVNNKITVVSYPVKIDSVATTVLYTLQREIQVLPGSTFTLTARLTDPSGAGRRISGTEIVDPLVADTHFKVSSVAGDNGNDLNGDVTITLTIGANAVEVAVQNTSANTGYLNKLEIVGKGIYLYDPVEYVATDATSITDHGERPLKFDLPNQDNPNTGKDFGDHLLETHKSPQTFIDRLSIRGNKSAAFLEEVITLEPGDRISVAETVTGINNEYFIQGYRLAVEGGNILDAEYTLKQAGGSEFWF